VSVTVPLVEPVYMTELNLPVDPMTANAPTDPVLTPSAVTTPVPVVTVAGAAPAPPPTTNALAARAALDVIAEVLEKYGIPPEVPDVNPVPPLLTVTVDPFQVADVIDPG
jgi:hypothetical protein